MSIEDQQCNECGASDWNKVLTTDYPERRKERHRTFRTVYECKECNAEGKHFEHNAGGTDTYSGAFQ